jgi:hypothetical protein
VIWLGSADRLSYDGPAPAATLAYEHFNASQPPQRACVLGSTGIVRNDYVDAARRACAANRRDRARNFVGIILRGHDYRHRSSFASIASAERGGPSLVLRGTDVLTQRRPAQDTAEHAT